MTQKSHVQVIVNPVAGPAASRRALKGLCRLIRDSGRQLRVTETQKRGDAKDFATQACDRNVDLLVVCGGDGTINEVVNGLQGEGVPILLVPAGTENILGKYFQTRLDEQWLWSVLTRGVEIRLDTGLWGDARFLLVVGAGFDAEACRILAEHRRGHISYFSWLGPLWQTFWGYEHPFLTVEADGERIHAGPGLVLVGNVPRYALGLKILHRARPDDGLLDVCVMGCDSAAGLMGHAALALRDAHMEGKQVVYRQARRVHIEADRETPVQVDGDFAGWLPAELKVDRQKARFLVSGDWAMPVEAQE